MHKLNKCSIWYAWILVFGMAAVYLLSHTMNAYAYGTTDCAGPRYGSNLGCTAGDVSITNITVVGGPSSCTGGESITLDLDATVNFAQPNRWDIGVFVSNDGKDPQLTPASGGAASCSVAILPYPSPFQNLDNDGCGDGGGGLSGVLHMTGVTIKCQAISGSSGNLYIPYVVSWDNQASPSGATCNSIADPVPNTTSKCNAPTVAQGTVSVLVLPSITNTDNITIINPGDTTNYIVVITNKTGVSLSNAVFKDPAVTYLTANSVTCTAGGGATCPASPTVAAMQGAGITIPTMPNNGSVTFTINATLSINAPAGESLTNTATITVGSQTNSASDTDTISSTPVGIISISPSSSSKNTVSPSTVVYNYTIYNLASSPASDTISLSATSSQGWTVQIRDASDSTTISSITVSANSSANFIIKVQVPSGVTVGTIDTTTITAISGNNPANTATATATTTVRNPIDITPNNTGSGGISSSVYYDHTVQNNTSSIRTINLAASFSGPSCAGWPVPAIYKSDRVTAITSVQLDPYGSSGDLDKDISIKITIPASAALGNICTVTVTASADSDSASATDTTTVKGLVIYSDSSYTEENYIFPVGSIVYAKAFGLTTTGNKKYYFKWYDSSSTLRETSPSNNPDGNQQLTDTYSISSGETNLGTWKVEVWLDETTDVKQSEANFYVGPDHVGAIYTGPSTGVNNYVPINLSLHAYSTNSDTSTHVVPLDSSGNLVKGNTPTTKDPLKITVTVSGSAKIYSSTLRTDAAVNNDSDDTNDIYITIPGGGTNTVTGKLSAVTGRASITISDSQRETVTITPSSYNSALLGSPSRDDSTSVTFSRMKIFDWREVVQ